MLERDSVQFSFQSPSNAYSHNRWLVRENAQIVLSRQSATAIEAEVADAADCSPLTVRHLADAELKGRVERIFLFASFKLPLFNEYEMVFIIA